MLFAFNVRAFNVAVLLIRRGLCIPLGTAGFKFFILLGILGKLACVVLYPNNSDFVYSISIFLFCFHNFYHNKEKKPLRMDIFKYTNECGESSRGKAVKVLLTPG